MTSCCCVCVCVFARVCMYVEGNGVGEHLNTKSNRNCTPLTVRCATSVKSLLFEIVTNQCPNKITPIHTHTNTHTQTRDALLTL